MVTELRPPVPYIRFGAGAVRRNTIGSDGFPA